MSGIMGRVVIVGVLALVTTGCGNDDQEKARLAFEQPSSVPSGTNSVADASRKVEPESFSGPHRVAGLGWNLPESWMTGKKRTMRVATYVVPAVSGDSEDGECAVFYFGSGQGGTIQANVDRWLKQFEQPDGSSSEEVAITQNLEVDGMKVTTVEVGGTYTAGMAPRTGAGTRKQDFHLLAAIVEGPEGAVFFKLTGPEQTVLDQRAGFDQLIRSVHRES